LTEEIFYGRLKLKGKEMRKRYIFIIMGLLLIGGISLGAYIFSLRAQVPSSDLREASVIEGTEEKAVISTELALDAPQPCLTTTAP
jgi:hypothetical protein